MAVKALNFKMDELEYADVKQVAAVYHMTITDVIKEALREYMEKAKADPFYRLTANVQEADGEPELASCMTLFGCDKAKAKQMNEAIARFDSFLPAKCKRGKIPAVHLFIFMKWCSLSVGYNSFLNYFNKRYKGKWETISRSAMSNVTQSSQFDTVKKEMHKKLAEMFPKSSFQQRA